VLPRRFAASGRQIALTFDACPGACDDALLATLERNGIPALLFLNSRWIDAHPGRAEQLAANPLFEIGKPWLLPGTQNEHDGVTFGEHEQPVVGVHADAMVFTLTAGRRMSCSW